MLGTLTGLFSLPGLCTSRFLFPARRLGVTGAELLLGLEVGEEMVVVRDVSEASRRGC